MRTPEQTEAIRQLNDAARARPGSASIANATIGFHALPDADRFAALALIVRYDRFDGNNDPYGEHDFGTVYKLASGAWTQTPPDDDLTIAQKVFWKVDYYDNSLRNGSEAPWDARVTKRVLTIMLAEEY